MYSISVVVAAYTMQRWGLLSECLESLFAQSVRPTEIVLCVDHNEELFRRASTQWGDRASVIVMRNPSDDHLAGADAHARAHGSRRRFGAGSARNAGIAATSAEVVAIIDDDARAEPDWLERLLAGYADGSTVAVGGAPLPRFETSRPDWFPRSFDWVFGCAYEGLPESTAPIRHLIGANMSMRRVAFDKVGGFGSVDFDDLDMCMRLGHEFGSGSLLYVPSARVHHFVPTERTTWRYFWRRCWFVNVHKVEAFQDLAEAANLSAEISFAVRTLTRGVLGELRRVRPGDWAGLRAAGAIVCGLTLAGLGNLYGQLRARTRR